jgi:serine/threonine-protein kinase
MAEVFLVTSGPDGAGKLLVIKCMHADLLSDPELLGMFLDEARLAVRLNHPNIVQTFEVDSVDGEHFLAMEYLAGQPLNKLMVVERRSPGSLTLGMKLLIVCDGLLGLQAAHELRDYDETPLGVVHRDVSPHNLFVTYDGVSKVVDFGIAKAAGRQQQTKTGVTAPKGKVRYMCPEQGRGEKVDRRADIFSMGAILWELVTGLRFWDKKEELEILFSLYQNQLPSLAAEGLDPALLAICSRALAASKEQRYETAEQFRGALLRYLAAVGEPVTTVDVGRRVQELFAEEKETPWGG